jgi:PAS domain S-box-containing protein
MGKIEFAEQNDFLKGGGETGALIQTIDWSRTSLGPPGQWPQSLRTSVSTALRTRFPILIWWGDDLTLIYNDAYIPIFAGKHPRAMGKPGLSLEGWGEEEVRTVIEPMLRSVMTSGEATWSQDQLLILERKGFAEEAYFTWSYSPIPLETGEIGGVLTIVTETTERVIHQRRMNVLRDLGEKALEAKGLKEAYQNVTDVLENLSLDIPFFLLYETDANKNILELVGRSSGAISEALVPARVNLRDDLQMRWPLKKVYTTGKDEVIHDLDQVVGLIKGNVWPEYCHTGFLTPVIGPGQRIPYGILICGISPRLEFDHNYRSFIKLLTNQIATALSNVYTIEEERKRAEGLAEMDRLKSTFFANISHEFRTPLTLMLSPLETVLDSSDNLTSTQKNNIEISLRNTLRLQKLVNTLLDFSRLEAGRMEVKLQPVDIIQYTKELIDSFRYTIERAGLQFVFNAGEITSTVSLDVDMWEKIVLNLISNAFKYTQQGRIEITLRQQDQDVLLSVSDTGVGISRENVERIFERFYRVHSSEGRSQEGTGIGLAMVRELVHLHHGDIKVQSEPGKGSTFAVRIPVQPANEATGKFIRKVQYKGNVVKNPFVEEASKWISLREQSFTDQEGQEESTTYRNKPRVLLADDNADMREYVQQLLKSDFEVRAVTNGEDAFNTAIHWGPELILSDIMMPQLDGFGLLKKLKSNMTTRNIPLIFLSARAGEEAKVEGITAGADDYLVKPFSAKELVARVTNHISISRMRREAEIQFFNLFRQTPAYLHVTRGADHIFEFFHPLAIPFVGRDMTGLKVREALPFLEGQGYFEMLDKVFREGVIINVEESPAIFETSKGKAGPFYFNLTLMPWCDVDGKIIGVLHAAFDVTDQVKSKHRIKESEERFRLLATTIQQIVWTADAQGNMEYLSDQWETFTGVTREEGLARSIDFIHEQDAAMVEERWKRSLEKGEPWQAEYRLKNIKTGKYTWFYSKTVPLLDENGKVTKWIGSATDIQHIKEQSEWLEQQVSDRTRELQESNASLRRSNEELQQFAYIASHDLQEPLRKIRTFSGMIKDNLGDPEFVGTYLTKVEHSAARMSALIKDVLLYSQVSKETHQYEWVALDDILQNVKSDFELLIVQKNAVIISDALPKIRGSRLQFHQLLSNLIGNSLKFTDGQAKIHISYALVKGKEVKEVGLEPMIKYHLITVSDNGIGFDPIYAEQIFGLFNRLHNRKDYSGTGIGLALCKKIVENYRGFIKATSEKGKGSVFSVYLPSE